MPCKSHSPKLNLGGNLWEVSILFFIRYMVLVVYVHAGPALGCTGGGAAGVGHLRGPLLLVRGPLPLARAQPSLACQKVSFLIKIAVFLAKTLK